MKTIAVNVKSGFRYLYYTNSGKIKAVTRHLLLNISVSQEGKGYWKIDDRAASDLSKLNVTQKMNLILARVIQLMLMQE